MHRPFLLLFAAGLGACGGAGASFESNWTGVDSGAVAGRPVVTWCPDARRLELVAMQGDAGVGLVLHPVQGLAPGIYDAYDPGRDTIIRPGAAAAGRWFTEQALRAYQSDAGVVEIREVTPRLRGRFDLRLKLIGAEDTVRLVGRFRNVSPDTCPGDTPPPPADDSVPSPPPGE